MPRSIGKFRQPINSVELHSFRDTSVKGVCSAVYAVVKQESGSTQGLVTAKSCLAKQNLTNLRLELGMQLMLCPQLFIVGWIVQ